MRRIAAICLFAVSVLHAQGVRQVQFQAPPPAAVQTGSVSLTGNPGSSEYCYWVVAHYTVGSSGISPAFCSFNAPTTLTVSNYLTVSWTPAIAASTFDVLRLANTTIFPSSGSCACAIATAISATSFVDQGASTSSYNLSPAPAAAASIILDNQDYAAPQLLVQLSGSIPFILGATNYPFAAGSILLSGGPGNPATVIAGLSYISGVLSMPAGTNIQSLDTGSPGWLYGSNSLMSNVPVSVACGASGCGIQLPQGIAVPNVPNVLTLAAPTSVQAAGLTVIPPATEGSGFVYWSLGTHVMTGNPTTGSNHILSAGNWSIGAGWGVGATITPLAGIPQAFTVQLTAAGTPTANPTATLTFSAAVTAAPHYICGFESDTTPGIDAFFYPAVPSTTSVQFVYLGTPVAGKNYVFNCFANNKF